ncbi:MAG TPA: hypothetical protein VIJ26_14045 [Thermoanaerobaculia bacterium]|jgi:hypothetical protein
MHRPRHRRRDPQRTGPIRNTGGAWVKGEPWPGPGEPEDDDPVSSGVREGYRLIDEQIRRGRRVAQTLDDEPRSRGPRGRRDREPGYEEPRSSYDDEQPWGGSDPFRLLGMPMRHLDRLVREILRQIRSARPDPLRLAGLLVQLQIEAFSEVARLGFGALGMGSRWGDAFREDVNRVQRDVDEGLREIEEDEEEGYEEWEAEEEQEDEPWEWPAAPSAPAVIRASVPIPVWVWSHERTEIHLDLPPGAQSQPLAVEPPLAVGAGEPPAPAFEAEFVALADGPTILRVEVPRELPAGLYPRRIVTRATREPVGTLTVQVGTLPTAPREGTP